MEQRRAAPNPRGAVRVITVETRRVYVSEVGRDRRGYLTLDAALLAPEDVAEEVE